MKVEVVLRFLMDQFQDPAAFLAEALHPKTPPEKGIEGILTSAGGRDLEARLMATRVKDAPGGQVLRVREASPPVPGDGGHAGDEALLRAAARHLAAPVEKLANRLELLAATHPLNEAQRRHLAAACEALECLQALLDQFRGPAPGNVREVELNALLESLRPRSEALLPEGARLRLKPAAGPLPLAVDPAHVEHVVQALITNAGEASPSTLTLRTGSLPGAARSEGKVFLELEDDGHGLAAGVRAQLFRPFFTTRPGRPGLGLWRARSLLALYGGTLTAEPVVPRGTRFRAEWPALP
jgi:signal transduction histidine kinase